MCGPLPKEEFDAIFSRVPRLTVEVVITSPERGVLLSLRDIEPCKGMWHLPGGTVRFGEPLVQAVARVARDELGLAVEVGEMLGYIEYPSHYENGLDCPVGVAFAARIVDRQTSDTAPADVEWFNALPDNMHDEQKDFLGEQLGLAREVGQTGG
jgi:ADP-ribose pyrophosphatase YjhB (NUDIX family)